MLSTLLVSALLVLQTGFAAADTAGRKSFLPETVKPRHRLLVRQDATCPAGSFLCDNGTGCCDIGTTCGYRASDNYPICEGGTCNGGPICLSGLCCDLGYVCDEVAKLCTLDTSGGGSSFSSSVPSFTAGSSSVRNSRSSGSSTRTVTRTLASAPTTTLGPVSTSTPDDQGSSSDFFGFGDTSTPQTTATPTTGSGFDGSNSQPTTIHSTLTRAGLPVPTGDAAALSANSGMKVFAGAVAGVLAFVL